MLVPGDEAVECATIQFGASDATYLRLIRIRRLPRAHGGGSAGYPHPDAGAGYSNVLKNNGQK